MFTGTFDQTQLTPAVGVSAFYPCHFTKNILVASQVGVCLYYGFRVWSQTNNKNK